MGNKQGFIKGAIILGISGIIAKFLGIFFRWPVTMLIGDEGIGLYQLAYPLYMFIIGIMSGFPIAISRMVSEREALGKRFEAYRVFKYSLYILIAVGIISSLLLYSLSRSIVDILKWREDSYFSLIATAFAPVFISIMDSYRGYFQGLQMMYMPALSQIIEQLGRIIVGVGLTYILLPYGIGYSAAGASFGACAGAIFGCIVLVLGFIKNRNKIVPKINLRGGESTMSIIRVLLSTAIPISIGMTIGSIMSLIDSIVVPARLLYAGFSERIATELYGQLTGKAHVLINVPLTLSVALGTSIVPAMSEVKALRSMERVSSRSESAVKVGFLLGLPSSVGLFILSDPVLNLIFPGKSGGYEILRILSLSVVFIVLAQILVSILQGVGDVMTPVRNLAIGSVIKLVLSYLLTGIPMLNVKGAAVATIAGYAVAAVLNLRDVIKRTYFFFDIDKMVLRPLFASLVMGIGVYIVYNKCMGFTGSNGISTISSIAAGICIYVLLLTVCGGISRREVAEYMKYRKQKK